MESLDRKIEDARDAVKKDDRNSQGQEIEFADPVKFLSTVSFSELPERPVLNAPTGVTTLSLLNTERVNLRNSSPVTISSLTNGQQGQTVVFLGDGNTTMENNTTIKTSTGADKLLAANATYTFTYIDSKWVESAAPASLTAGAGLSIAGTTISNLYVGKHICLFGGSTGSISLTASTLRFIGGYCRADLTGMNNMRVSYGMSALGTGNVYPVIFWGDNATPTNQISFAGTGAQRTGALGSQVILTDTVAIPAGLKVATAWLGAFIFPTATTTGTFQGMYLEFTP